MATMITDDDLKMFQERAKTEFASRCDTGGIAWDSVIWDLCNEVRRLRKALEAIDKNTDLLDIAKDIAPQLHPSHSFVAVQIRKTVRAALAATAAAPGSGDKVGDAKAPCDGAGAADKGPPVFKVGERVDWTDPVTGEKTSLWTVLDVPEIPAEGPSGDEVYTISDVVGLSEVKVHARELSYPEGGPL